MSKKNKIDKELKEVCSPRENRKLWFRGFKKFIRLLNVYKKPDTVYLGKRFQRGSLIISNHVGSYGPLTLELHTELPIRFWGTYEMNSGLRSAYKYQTNIYYHEKKCWNIHLARLFCLIATPITCLFYKGLNLISTYRDARFVKTIHESINSIRRGESVIVFPEDSSQGYFDDLRSFYAGFVMFAETCYKRGIDLPIYVTYLNRKAGKYMVDAPVCYSELAKLNKSRTELAEMLLNRCNELGKMSSGEVSQAIEEKSVKRA